MENSTATQQQLYTLWISQSKHIVSFHRVESDDYKPMVFSDQNEKMEFVFKKCSSGFRIQ